MGVDWRHANVFATQHEIRFRYVVLQVNARLTLDYSLTAVTSASTVSAQELDGGNGLAYNRKSDTAYVANHAVNSITAISRSCLVVTPIPTPSLIPVIPIPFFS